MVKFEILTRDEIDLIHESTVNVLERVGVKVFEPGALKLLGEAGAEVNQKEMKAKIPEELLKECLKKAPRRFSLYSRKSGYKLDLEDGRTYFSTQGTAVFIIDAITGERRPSTLKDVEKFYKLADALPNVHHATLVVHPTDIPEHVAHAYALSIAFRNTTKTVDAYVSDKRTALDTVKIASVVSGDKEKLSREPLLLMFYNPVSPLQHSKGLLEALQVFAQYRQPVIIAPECLSGATAPVTLAGLLVQQNAEVLSGIVIAELYRPGAPVLYGTVSTVMDMRTGNIALGAIEGGLINTATAQLARFYGIPCRGYGGTTEAKAANIQAGFEKAFTLLMAAMSGVNFIYDAVGSLDSTLAASYEQAVIDDELCGIVSRALNGISVDEETLAVEVIEKVGSEGNYLRELHTVQNLRKEHYIPALLFRQKWGAWAASKDILNQAREKAERILREHQPESLDRDVEAELMSTVKEIVKTA
ncbi:MAG: trimethylamine methyltransferase family protein [Thermofilaceae archaeon]